MWIGEYELVSMDCAWGWISGIKSNVDGATVSQQDSEPADHKGADIIYQNVGQYS